jgi:hypothetical protein
MKIIIVTIPASVSHETILKEIIAINNTEDLVGNHKVGRNRPRQEDIEGLGFVHQGELKYVADYLDTIEQPAGFTCSTTGKRWEKGHYIQFENIRELEVKEKIKGFQGFRYMNMKKGRIDHGKKIC